MAKSKDIVVAKDDFGGGLAVPSYLQGVPSVLDEVEITQSLPRLKLSNKGKWELMDGLSTILKMGESIMVRFLHIHPTMQRRMYEEAYDEDSDEMAIPACWSNDGVTPDEASAKPQSAKCASCPKNQKGSNGKNRKACSTSRNTVVQLLDDSPVNSDPVLLRVGAMGHYGDVSDEETMNFTKLTKLAARNNLALQAYPVEVGAEPDVEVAQPVFFVENKPASEAEFKAIQELRESLDMESMVSLSYDSVSGDDEDAPEEPVKREAATRKTRRTKAAAPAEAAEEAEEPGTPEQSDEGSEGAAPGVSTTAAPPGAERTRRSRKPPVEAAAEGEDGEDGLEAADAPNAGVVNSFLDGLDDL